MIPTHNSTKGMGMLKRQKYFFELSSTSIAAWNQALTTLFPEPAFHDVIEAHGLEGYVDDQWNIRFRSVGDTAVKDGPRYSRLQKSLWDAFGPTFDDYGVRLINKHTGQPVPVGAR